MEAATNPTCSRIGYHSTRFHVRIMTLHQQTKTGLSTRTSSILYANELIPKFSRRSMITVSTAASFHSTESGTVPGCVKTARLYVSTTIAAHDCEITTSTYRSTQV
eukprot:4620975-Amphidinium_carterae.1